MRRGMMIGLVIGTLYGCGDNEPDGEPTKDAATISGACSSDGGPSFFTDLATGWSCSATNDRGAIVCGCTGPGAAPGPVATDPLCNASAACAH